MKKTSAVTGDDEKIRIDEETAGIEQEAAVPPPEAEKGSKKSRIIKKVCNIAVIGIFAVILVVFSVVMIRSLVAGKKGVPNKPMAVFGTYMFVVQTGSMEPMIKVNDVILVKKVKNSDAELTPQKDIIVFYNPEENKIIVHMVWEITDEGIVTRGIANDRPDDYIVTEYYGIYKKSSDFLRTLYGFITSAYGFFIVVIAPLIYVTATETRDLTKKLKKLREGRRAAAGGEELLPLDEATAKKQELEAEIEKLKAELEKKTKQ